jgi:hypothetical protein
LKDRPLDQIKRLNALIEMAYDISSMFASLTPPDRRELLKNCVDQIVVKQGQVRVTHPATNLTDCAKK